MNRAVFCVTPIDRASWCDDVPFFALAKTHTAGKPLV
jgi:hypothetical protein